MSEVILTNIQQEELAQAITRAVHLLAEIENNKSDLAEVYEQMKDKGEVTIPKADFNKLAKAAYDDTFIDTEKGKLEKVEDLYEAIKAKLNK